MVDLAQAHILALDNIDIRPSAKYNLGNGVGYTNLEVLREVEKVSGKKIDYEMGKRRPGDPAQLVASSLRAKKELNWQPRFGSLENIVRSAWKWHSEHSNGYQD